MVKQTKNFIFLLFFIFSTTQVNSQFSNRFKFSVNDTGVFKLFLSPEVLTKLNYQFGDIQIKDASGKLVPFVFKKDFKEDIDNIEIGKVINQGYRNKLYEFVIETELKNTLNQLEFTIDKKEYLGKCDIYGSESLDGDFVLIKKESIIHGFNENGVYRQINKINFSASKFKYYKILINGIEGINKVELKPIKQRYTNSSLNFYPARIIKDSLNTRNESVIDYEIDKDLTVSGFIMELNSSDFYRRNFTLFNWVNSISSEKGIQDFYDPILKGTLIAFDSNKFNSRNFKTKKGRIIIENLDDQSIPIKYLVFYEYKYYLLIKIKEKGEYLFEYGNPTATLPEFDFQFIAENFLDAPVINNFYDFSEIKIMDEEERGNDYSQILIILLIIVSAVLVWFSIKLIKK